MTLQHKLSMCLDTFSLARLLLALPAEPSINKKLSICGGKSEFKAHVKKKLKKRDGEHMCYFAIFSCSS